MKKLRSTLFLSGGLLLLMSNNCFAASSSDTSTNQMKYIAIGVAVIIVILLLFLGFKMDSKEDNGETFSKPKKSKKKEIGNEETKYEEDTVDYENDFVNPNDLSESTEYEEDEDSLFDMMDENSDENIPKEGFYTSSDSEDLEPEEEYGEEFDTSVIDNIEDEEDIVIPKKSSDETIIFNNPPVEETVEPTPVEENPIEEKLNEVSEEEPIISENEESDENLAEEINEVDPLMDELSKVNPEAESNFGGFSVSSGTQATENTEDVEKEEKSQKKYTKAKKSEIEETTGMTQEDFLAQMEENMKKDKAERDAKKATKKKK